MEAIPKQIVYYQTPDKKVPFEIWHDRIEDKRLKKAVRQRLERAELGNYGDCEPVGENVLELRLWEFGVRIYFAEVGRIMMLLLCAGDKSSQVKDIAKAKEYWAEYRSRDDKEVQ